MQQEQEKPHILYPRVVGGRHSSRVPFILRSLEGRRLPTVLFGRVPGGRTEFSADACGTHL